MISLRVGGVQHTIGKLLTRATTFLQTSSQSEVCTQNYGPPKVGGVPTLEILGLLFGSPKTKRHLGVGPVVKHKVYYKGEGFGFPQVYIVLPVAYSCTKSAPIMH
jgi:hypothetical protein